MRYRHVEVVFDDALATATMTLRGPDGPLPDSVTEVRAMGADVWALALLRELDDALLDLRFNAAARSPRW